MTTEGEGASVPKTGLVLVMTPAVMYSFPVHSSVHIAPVRLHVKHSFWPKTDLHLGQRAFHFKILG